MTFAEILLLSPVKVRVISIQRHLKNRMPLGTRTEFLAITMLERLRHTFFFFYLEEKELGVCVNPCGMYLPQRRLMLTNLRMHQEYIFLVLKRMVPQIFGNRYTGNLGLTRYT